MALEAVVLSGEFLSAVVVTAMFALKRLAPFAQSAIPALKVMLTNSREPYFQIVAAATLGKIAPETPDCISILVAAQDDPNSLHRAAGCEFLGERRHSAVLNTMKLFNDPDFVVRFAASKAYSKWTGNWMHAVAICVAMLKDDNETNRAMGAECLLSIRRYVGDHLDLLTMAMADSSWQARLDIEELLAELRYDLIVPSNHNTTEQRAFRSVEAMERPVAQWQWDCRFRTDTSRSR